MELQRVRYDLATKQQQYRKYKPGKATGKLTLTIRHIQKQTLPSVYYASVRQLEKMLVK